MRLPVDDWQFWVATALAAAALWYVLTRVLPLPALLGKRKQRGRRVNLTVGGKPPER